jgi:negative regulator of replication initiation
LKTSKEGVANEAPDDNAEQRKANKRELKVKAKTPRFRAKASKSRRELGSDDNAEQQKGNKRELKAKKTRYSAKAPSVTTATKAPAVSKVSKSRRV